MEGCESKMRDNYVLGPEALVMVQGSSKGAQPKYYQDGYWYKVNVAGYEGKSEELVSKVLSCSNVKKYVTYEQCMINGKAGCRSKNFLGENESFISFQRLFDIYEGGDLTAQTLRMSDVQERIDFVKEFIEEKTGFDCSNYLSQILTLDMLTANTDRHFHNLGLIVNTKENAYKEAPIFDNGNALLSQMSRFDAETIEENMERVIGQPFSSNLERQAYEAGFGLKLDYQALNSLLGQEQNSRAVEVLRYQLNRYKNIIPNFEHPRESLDAQLERVAEEGRIEEKHMYIHKNPDISR